MLCFFLSPYITSRSIILLFVFGRSIKGKKAHTYFLNVNMCIKPLKREWGSAQICTKKKLFTWKKVVNGKSFSSMCFMHNTQKNSLNIFMNKMWGLRQIIDRIGMLRAWWQADKRRGKKYCVWGENSSLLRNELWAGRKKKKSFPLLKLAKKRRRKYAAIKFNEFMIFPPRPRLNIWMKIHCKSREEREKKGCWWHSTTIYDNSTRYWIWKWQINENQLKVEGERERENERIFKLRHAQAHES